MSIIFEHSWRYVVLGSEDRDVWWPLRYFDDPYKAKAYAHDSDGYQHVQVEDLGEQQ